MPAGLLRRHLIRTTAIVLAAAAGLALSQSTIVFTNFRGSRTFGTTVAFMLPSWLIMTASVPVLLWLVRRFSFAPGTQARSTVVHVGVGLAFALTHVSLVGACFLAVVGGELSWERLLRTLNVSFRYLFYQDVLAYGAIIAIFMVLHYSDLRTRLAEARLTALRAQLNPHFLFNTLNAVSTLALQGKRHEVTEMLGRLGALLRVTLDEQAQEVPLAGELNFVDDYLAIQHVRFADRFRVEKDIAPDTIEALVPSLILQPIVENAVEHGVGRSQGSALLRIRAFRQADSVTIEVSDTGPGFPLAVPRKGIGLANTQLRLEELYGTNQRFEYGNLAGGGATVRMTLPLRLTPADEATGPIEGVLASPTCAE